MDVVGIFPGDHAQELRVILVAILVVGTNPDQLFKLPAVTHGGDHLSEFVLMTLENSVHKLPVRFPAEIVPDGYPFFEKLDKISNVVELRLLQGTLLQHVLVQHKLAVSQVVEDGDKVCRVSVYQVGASLVLLTVQIGVLLADSVEKRFWVFTEGRLGSEEHCTAHIQPNPFLPQIV